MPGQIPPHLAAQSDQSRAWAQDHLNGFIANYRRQITRGDDPNYMFATLCVATNEALEEMAGTGRTVAMILTAAVERLARGDS